MEKKTIERIKKINTIDTEILPLVLIRAQELFWRLNRIIEVNTNITLSKVNSNKKRLIVVKELLSEFGNDVSHDYIENLNGNYFSNELLKYLGFDVMHEVIDDIIFDYCSSTEKDKDINLLKQMLIEETITFDKIDEEAEFRAQQEYDKSWGRGC